MKHDQNTYNEDACRALLAELLEGEHDLYEKYAASNRERHDTRRSRTGNDDQGENTSPLDHFLQQITFSRRGAWLMLVGNALWSVFSDNNEVRGPTGAVYDLGTWRGSGGVIAEVMNARYSRDEVGGRFDYIDFYGGVSMRPPKTLSDAPAVWTLYVHCFQALRQRGCTWAYHPPAVFVVDVSGIRDGTTDEGKALEAYDPYSDVAEHLGIEREPDDSESKSEKRPGASDDQVGEEGDELEPLQDAMRDANEEARRDGLKAPPVIVRAYCSVYGQWPAYIGSH